VKEILLLFGNFRNVYKFAKLGKRVPGNYFPGDFVFKKVLTIL